MVYQCSNLVAAQSSPPMLQSHHSRLPRGILPGKDTSINFGVKQALSGLAASIILLSQPNLATAASPSQGNVCQLASATETKPTLPLDDEEGNGMMMMMRAMTVKNFDPTRYAGRWFEVASLKRGFAGQGQEDCHCTQCSLYKLFDKDVLVTVIDILKAGKTLGMDKNVIVSKYQDIKGVYTFDEEIPAIQVDTFCIHGGPNGYITGIRGKVQCLSEEDKDQTQTDLERTEMIKGKCYLRFPTLPFIPKEPYDVIATDYDNYAIVSGAKDKSFVQIYSRTPNPGPEFIEKYKSYLATFGYDPSKIKDTPQDCEVMSNSQLSAMMSMSGMQKALTNQFPDLELKAPVAFNPFTSVFDTLKKLVELYFK